MKKLKYKFILIFLFIFLQLNKLLASHMMGGEISYRWLGNKQYEITAKIYRDCRGIPLNSPKITAFSVGQNPINLSYTRTSIQEITIRCKDSTSKVCGTGNITGTRIGIELHTFKDTIDFSVSPYNALLSNSNCEVFFEIDQCCKNGAITTITPGDLYVESMINICNSNYINSSPQFYSSNSTYAYLNNPFFQNYAAKDFIDFDSLGFELVAPLNGHNSPESYIGNLRAKIPMSPYCPPNPSTVNCKADLTKNPPRGFYFDNLTGSIIFTPTSSNELGVIAMKTTEYRRDTANNNWIKVGYVIRDLQLSVIYMQGNTVPTFKLNSSYNFKLNEKTCFDVESYDTLASGYSNSNKGDETNLKLIETPSGASFKLLDSTAKLKTGRFCWTPHDSIYLKIGGKSKIRTIPLTIELNDNYCEYPSIVQRGFLINLIPPDSIGTLTINTFIDENKDNIKNNSDSAASVLLKFEDKYSTYNLKTNNKGVFEDNLGVGKYTVGLASHPYYKASKKDSTVYIKHDVNHIVNFGINRKNGIYGRIYEDKNNNCVYDIGEFTYSGYKITTDSGKYTGISDNDGVYYIKVPSGSYNLACNYPANELNVNCPSTKKITLTAINPDSVYLNKDFAITLKPNYADIATFISVGRLRRGNNANVNFICKNLGHKTIKNIKLIIPGNPNFKLTIGNNIPTPFGDTSFIIIDSILPFKKKEFPSTFLVDNTFYTAGSSICFKLLTDKNTYDSDSLKSNNLYQACGIVNAPFDPNEKLTDKTLPISTLDSIISYSINFQNTGTDTANRVIVVDTIDTNLLDISKFRLNWSQYPCEPIISNNIITFIFDNINLPFLSQSGEKSIGSFNFSLGLNSKVQQEQLIQNKAAIYFDFEKPIFTKLDSTYIYSPLKISKLFKSAICKNNKNYIVYNSLINLEDSNNLTLEISDTSGSFINSTVLKKIKTNKLTDSIYFDIPKSLGFGNYTIRLKSDKPYSIGITKSGIRNIELFAPPSANLTTNLKNNNICEKDTLNLKLSNSALKYLIYINTIPNGSFSNSLIYNFPINLKDSFKIIIQENTNLCTDTIDLKPKVNSKPIVNAQIFKRKMFYCQNDSVSFKFSGAKYYSIFKNNSLINNQYNLDTFYNILTVNSTFKIIGEDSNSCKNNTDTFYTTIRPLPNANFNLLKNPICLGDTLVIQLNNFNKFNVYHNNIVIYNNIKAANLNIYNCKDLDKIKVQEATSYGCKKTSAEQYVYVNSLPPNIFSFSPNPLCQGDTLTMNLDNQNIYSIYKNSVLVHNKIKADKIEILNIKDNDKIRIQEENPSGCKKMSSDTTIIINPRPDANFILSSNPICENDSLVLKFSNNNFYSVFINDTLRKDNLNTNEFYLKNIYNGDKIKIQETNLIGCKKKSDEVAITVYPSPNAAFNVFPNPACENDSIKITRPFNNSYNIYYNDSIKYYNVLTNNFNLEKVKNNDKIRILETNSYGCTKLSDEIKMVVNSVPNTDYTIMPNPSCEKDTVRIFFNEQNSRYNVFQNNNKILSNINSNSVVLNNPYDKHIIKIEATNDVGCTKVSYETSLVVNSLPMKPFIIINNNQLSVNYNGKIQWYRNGELLSNISNTLVNAASGTYYVVVSNNENCSNKSELINFYNTSIEDNLFTNSFIYPNPTNGLFKLANILHKNTDFKIFDSNGRMFLINYKIINNEFEFDLSGFSTGIYMLEISCINSKTYKKINLIR